MSPDLKASATSTELLRACRTNGKMRTRGAETSLGHLLHYPPGLSPARTGNVRSVSKENVRDAAQLRATGRGSTLRHMPNSN